MTVRPPRRTCRHRHSSSPPGRATLAHLAVGDRPDPRRQGRRAIVDYRLCPDAWWPPAGWGEVVDHPGPEPSAAPDQRRGPFLRAARQPSRLVLWCSRRPSRWACTPGCRHRCLRGGWEAVVVRQTMLGMLHSAGWQSRVIDRSATRGAVAMWRRRAETSPASTSSIEQASPPATCRSKDPTGARAQRQRAVPVAPRDHAPGAPSRSAAAWGARADEGHAVGRGDGRRGGPRRGGGHRHRGADRPASRHPTSPRPALRRHRRPARRAAGHELVREAEASTRLDGGTRTLPGTSRVGPASDIPEKGIPTDNTPPGPITGRSGGASTTPSPSWV